MTAEELAEQARLERSNADTRFRSIVDASPMGVHLYSLEADGKLVLRGANAAADRIIGIVHAPLIGLTLEEAFPPLAATEIPNRYREAATVGTPWTQSLINYEDNRIKGSYEVHAFQTSPGYMAVMFLDITERLKSEEALRLKTEELDRFFASTLDLLCIADTDGYFRRLNPEWERTLGYRLEDLEGRRFLEFVHPEDFDATLDAISRLAENMPVLNFTNRYRHRDGSWRWLEWRSFPVGRSIYAAARDITANKLLEQEQARLQGQLEHAMRMEAVGRLAGGIAHDFNNLLTAILGNVEMELETMEPSNPSARSLQEVVRAAKSAASLTRQLLAFSRKQIVEPRVLDLNQELVRLHKMLARLIGEDVHLETTLREDIGTVRVDPGQFEQVVVNLAVNARDAMPNGGSLVIETANVDLDESYRSRHPQSPIGPCVMLAVSDTGHGMTPEVLEHVFEPFFTTKPKDRGTGLGLATTYGIVKQAGGSIEVYSEVGHGTTFKVYLPRLDQPAEDWRPADEVDVVGGVETVLVVEDEEQVRELACRVLAKLGYRILPARHGAEAIEVAGREAGPIHLLLTDVVMPGMSGRELANRLAPTRAAMRILYASGYTENVIAHHGVLDPGILFLSKPYTPRTLAVAVRAALDG